MFTTQKAIIFGSSGLTLTPLEREFFSRARPLGFILFGRNIEDKKQVTKLVHDLRDSVGNKHAPILIDQEGGRVVRLKPAEANSWYTPPSASVFGKIAEQNLEDAKKALELSTTLIALDLLESGVTCDTIPVLDVLTKDSHNVIGDRSYGADKSIVAELGEVVCKTLTKFGIVPVIKHIPGHGKARADSHKELPIVTESYEDLVNVDFYPFKRLKPVALAMTAHVLYKSIDPDKPATLSKKVIDEIRNTIGFENLILTDCILMNALSGHVADRAQEALAAGCDIILKSRGTVDEMEEVINKVPFITDAQNKILMEAFGHDSHAQSVDRTKIMAELSSLFHRYEIVTKSKAQLGNDIIDPTD